MHLTLWQMLILAVVQGITEFLPISSDGHLVVVSALMFNGDQEVLDKFIEVNVALHIGTFFSILVYYWQRVWKLLSADRRVLGLIIVGTIPAVLLGLPLRFLWPEVLSNPLLAGVMLVVTGGLLLLTAGRQEQTGTYQSLSLAKVFGIGVAQALAILPGLSRSGTTITSGLASGLAPRAAATFSFLLALPAIGGAGLLETVKIAREGTSSGTPLSYLVFGALVAFFVGLGAIAGLMKVIEKGKLYWFAWWCIPLGLCVIVWQLSLRIGA